MGHSPGQRKLKPDETAVSQSQARAQAQLACDARVRTLRAIGAACFIVVLVVALVLFNAFLKVPRAHSRRLAPAAERETL